MNAIAMGIARSVPAEGWNHVIKSSLRSNYRLYVFLLFSAWRSSANAIKRSISLGYSNPVAAHSFGYMLIAVKPGIVLISFR